MKNREEILSAILTLQDEIEEREKKINELCDEAKKIIKYEKVQNGYLDSILSHKTFRPFK